MELKDWKKLKEDCETLNKNSNIAIEINNILIKQSETMIEKLEKEYIKESGIAG